MQTSPEQESEEGSRDDGASGAAADLATLCTGVAAKGGLAQWSRAVERSAYEALTKAIAGRRDAADEEQYPRYMLLQKLHHAVVRRLLTPPADLLSEDALWDRRAHRRRRAEARDLQLGASPGLGPKSAGPGATATGMESRSSTSACGRFNHELAENRVFFLRTERKIFQI